MATSDDDAFNVDLLFRYIAHWVGTKPKTYLGSTYGAPTEDLLQKPLSSPLADAYLAKMRVDLPVIAALPNGAVSMSITNDGIDRLNIYISINGASVSIADLEGISRGAY